jgi:hypothetical protein
MRARAEDRGVSREEALMKGTPIRATLGFTLLCVSVFLLPPPAATAATDTSFPAFTSDPEDWVGQ